MISSKPIWHVSEIQNESGRLVIRKLDNAIPSDRETNSDYVVYFTFGCLSDPKDGNFYSSEDTDTLYDIDENDIPCLLYTSPSPRDRG